MEADNRRHNITLRLAGYPAIPMHGITPSEEEVLRLAERQINSLWDSWKSRFPKKTEGEVMAMVALRFAELYFISEQRAQATSDRIDRFEKELDELLATGPQQAATADSPQ